MYSKGHISLEAGLTFVTLSLQYFSNLQGLPERHAQSRHFDVFLQSHDVILYSLESRRAKGGMGDEFIFWVKWSSVRFS